MSKTYSCSLTIPANKFRPSRTLTPHLETDDLQVVETHKSLVIPGADYGRHTLEIVERDEEGKLISAEDMWLEEAKINTEEGSIVSIFDLPEVTPEEERSSAPPPFQ